MELKENMELKEKLAALREGRGLTQGEVAAEADVARQTVSRWERGTAVPSMENLITLSRLYGVSLDELVNGRPEPEEKPEEEPAEGLPITVAAEEPDAPPEPRKRWAKIMGAAALAACLALAAIASVITIWTAVFKEPEEPKGSIIRTDDIEPEYIDPAEVQDWTDTTVTIEE